MTNQTRITKTINIMMAGIHGLESIRFTKESGF